MYPIIQRRKFPANNLVTMSILEEIRRGRQMVVFSVALSFLATSTLPAQRKKRTRDKATAKQEQIHLIERGESRYRIVIPSTATPDEVNAGNVLQDYLLQVSGAVLPVVPANMAKSRFEIVLGQNERIDELNTDINYNILGQDGFIIKTDSMRLIIAGGNEKGTLYGVYAFLEKYLGCRMYSPTVKVIPKMDRIVLAKIDDMQVPRIKFRDTHYRITWNREYTDWHKLDHNENGGRPDWGLWVHTFNQLVPPEVYAKEHPEYYAMIDGRRVPTQLCLTNPDVLEITIKNLRREIAKNPHATYWSVSQNDNRQYCRCDACMAINDREGSPSGSIINFVNKVAGQFPDKVISTLAYEYSRKAPRTLRPAENVNIMLCSIEANRDKPIPTDSTSEEFRRDVVEWGKIAEDIIVWDYVIQFTNLISPFPNLHVLKPNIQFFADHGVTAMFEQGNREVGGEFAELRAYMISKLLWNPDEDADSLMNDFLRGYYGAASGPIRQYIDTMREALLRSGQPLRIFGSPNEASTSYLTPWLISVYTDLFDKAEATVIETPELLERVRIARLPLEFAIMEQAKKTYAGEHGLFVKTADNKWIPRKDIRQRIDPFVDLCIRQGVTRVKEWSTSPEAYRSAMYRLYALGMKEHLAYHKKVTFLSPSADHLPEGSEGMLTDGARGSHDYAYNWLVFSGQDLDVIVDLEQVQKVHHIESAYFQYAAWLRLLPSQVEYQISLDGEKYETVGTIENTLPIDQYDGYQRDFVSEFEPRDARYVRVIARTIGNTPEWHPGSGQPARMLVDEIVVE